MLRHLILGSFANSSPLHAGRVEHVVQFTVKAELVRPVPEVRQVELKVGVLHDAQRIFKIMRAASLELKQDQVLRTADVRETPKS